MAKKIDIHNISKSLDPILKWGFRILLILVLIWGLSKATGLSDHFKNWFDFSTEIDDTANIVDEVRSIAELATVSYYDEVVMHFTKENKGSKSNLNQFAKQNMNLELVAKDRIILIGKGTVKAGFNLEKFSPEDVTLQGDTLTIMLPHAEYLDATLNPSDFEYFKRRGFWSHEEDTKVKLHARKRLIKDADRNHLLQRAEQAGISRLTTLLTGKGHEVVVVKIKD